MGSGNVVAVCVLVAGSVYHALAYPIAPEGLGREGGWNNRDYIHAVLGVAALLSSVTTLLACVCCKRSRGFKQRHYTAASPCNVDNVFMRILGEPLAMLVVSHCAAKPKADMVGGASEVLKFPHQKELPWARK
ncbi:hypothetical protein Hamer_G014761 [Homarus americanus]|uniref:Uncharacterized protein n=1 Tax=Homarus americanus TaxID=6706 RepID=A0A8J5N1R3_HOMAM|nr:hypothetical protein Hamer_G014761 [Homarus americanus]